VKSVDDITDLNNIPIPCINIIYNLCINIFIVAERRVFIIILLFYIKLVI